MFSIFEQPYTLLIAAAVAFRIVCAIFPDIGQWWQWLLLALCLAGLYGINLLVSIDMIRLSRGVFFSLNIFLTVAILVLLALPALDAKMLKKRQWRTCLLPLLLGISAFACDGLISTNREKVDCLILTALVAVEQEDADTLEKIIAADYSDSANNTKDILMEFCRRAFSQPLITRNTRISVDTRLSPTEATTTLIVATRLDENGWIYHEYGIPSVMSKVELKMHKQPDHQWLISGLEIVEINRHPVSWQYIQRQNPPLLNP